MGFSTIIATALLLSSEACAAQVLAETKTHRRRKVKIYSSSSIRRGELSSGAVDPYLGLPDEREERHLQGVLTEGSISIGIASMPDNLSFSLPIMGIGPVIPSTTTVAPSFSVPTTVAPTTTEAPEFCIEVYEPVCGEDGITYDNECKAGLVNVAVDYEGECLKPPTTAAPESATTTVIPIAPGFVDTATTAPDTIDTTTVATTPDETTPSPTPFPTNSLGLGFESVEGAPSSAMMTRQSAIVIATVVCAVAGVVALV
eukprot:CAMPEP_0113402108 /NCGR_PEP_ID=MMETSP0013_2-20120614/17078_1 /TAXON_ID=2843 ORGANISM="Skeletonema costatum, Strain 1716" /NCGR_SAMPLE_ID=MMETSP0013_2 /ASSEMBLY_ACC=CAM_ASM_000158 /LENGTH=257 /DNA_ID=CAMNT_0000287417 /DNA_START=8 /DNA_END=781 /DNA_ORIENTATION=- /assembly_acc=CAM_ASM_000158